MDCPTHPPIRVLLIESDDRIVALVRQSLQAAAPQAYVLDRVVDLQEGLVQLASEAFDVTLIDLAIGDASSADVLAVLESYAGELPMVAMLNVLDPAMALQAMRKGAQECLIENRAGLAELPRTLQHAITRHQLTRPLPRQRLSWDYWPSNCPLCSGRPMLNCDSRPAEGGGGGRWSVSVRSCWVSRSTNYPRRQPMRR